MAVWPVARSPISRPSTNTVVCCVFSIAVSPCTMERNCCILIFGQVLRLILRENEEHHHLVVRKHPDQRSFTLDLVLLSLIEDPLVPHSRMMRGALFSK